MPSRLFSNPLQLPVWVWLFGAVFFNGPLTLLFMLEGHFGAVVLVVAGNWYTFRLGCALLGRKLINEKKVTAADLA